MCVILTQRGVKIAQIIEEIKRLGGHKRLVGLVERTWNDLADTKAAGKRAAFTEHAYQQNPSYQQMCQEPSDIFEEDTEVILLQDVQSF